MKGLSLRASIASGDATNASDLSSAALRCLLVPLYAITIFVSATLLFSVQPLFGKLLLPVLGGASAVWNTCMVFFQITLLLGYGYTHFTSRMLSPRAQVALHVAIGTVAALTLPLALPRAQPPGDGSPVLWLASALAVSLGLPFFVMSATAPMLQRWFSTTGHPDAGNPYVLYAVSNAGSLIALVGYPLVVEPNLALSVQSRLWSAAYGVMLVLVAICGVMARAAGRGAEATRHTARCDGESEGRPAMRDRARWVVLAAIPSSLMLGVTTHLTTDIAPIPLLWVVPLALYLITFVLAFARTPLVPGNVMIRAFPILVVPLAIIVAIGATQPLWLVVTLYVVAFFVAAMVCHGELARTRPPARSLTEFYLWMSIGGALGGMFNGLVAPLVFDSLVEFPLALLLACLVTPRLPGAGAARSWADVALPAGLAVLAIALVRFAPDRDDVVRHTIIAGLPALVVFAFRRRPLRFALGVGVLLLVLPGAVAASRVVLHAERTFFGVHRVDDREGLRVLFHGTTIHGAQKIAPASRLEPTLYYYPGGPADDVFRTVAARRGPHSVAVVGLGAGVLACLGPPGRQLTYYEIDPAVAGIAANPGFFTFLRDCTPAARVVLGDARISLASAADSSYGAIVVDAFSSDAIPSHLLTREAMELYFTKLTEDGVLALHLSNRHLDLTPVVGSAARDLGLVAFVRTDRGIEELKKRGGAESHWAVIARNDAALAGFSTDKGWGRLPVDPKFRTWTDDFSNIVAVLRWK